MEKHKKNHNKYPKDRCLNCDKKYEMTPENTRFNIYDYQQYCNHLYTTCTKCNDCSSVLFTTETPEDVAEWGFSIHHEKYPPEHIVEAYGLLYGLEPPEEHELTTRAMAKVAFLEYLLETERITAEEFADDSSELII